MTLQTDLQDAVARVESDSQILHNIIHGDDQTIVNTEGGGVKTPSKAIKDIEATIQAGLTNLEATADQLVDAVDSVTQKADEAETHAQTAQTLANSLNLPTDLNGHAGQLLAINETEDGYEPIESKAVFYGLRKDGAKLIAVSGEGTFDASEFPVWMVGLPRMNYAVNENGHLLINI
jgi:hypothetical protein